MSKQVTIDGVQYKNPTVAAKALVAAGKTLSEAAEATGISYQTVYANTKGEDKVKVRRAKYRVLAMGKSGKRTASEIAKKVGLNVSKVVAILKGAKITVLTKEAKAAAKATKSGKVPKAPKVKKSVDEVPLTPVQIQAEEDMVDEIPEDVEAAAQAMADMAATNDK